MSNLGCLPVRQKVGFHTITSKSRTLLIDVSTSFTTDAIYVNTIAASGSAIERLPPETINFDVLLKITSTLHHQNNYDLIVVLKRIAFIKLAPSISLAEAPPTLSLTTSVKSCVTPSSTSRSRSRSLATSCLQLSNSLSCLWLASAVGFILSNTI